MKSLPGGLATSAFILGRVARVLGRDVRSATLGGVTRRGDVVRHDGSMTVPGLAPRGGFGGIVAVWAAAAVVSIVVGLATPSEWRAAWMAVGLAGCLVLAFVVQLVVGHAEGFVRRVAASVIGAFVVMGLIGVGLGLASLFAG